MQRTQRERCPQWREALVEHKRQTEEEVQRLVRDTLVQRPRGPDVTPGYDLSYSAVLYHEVYNLLHMIDTLPRDALATGAATAESVLAAVTMVAPGIDPDQAFGHNWCYPDSLQLLARAFLHGRLPPAAAAATPARQRKCQGASAGI